MKSTGVHHTLVHHRNIYFDTRPLLRQIADVCALPSLEITSSPSAKLLQRASCTCGGDTDLLEPRASRRSHSLCASLHSITRSMFVYKFTWAGPHNCKPSQDSQTWGLWALGISKHFTKGAHATGMRMLIDQASEAMARGESRTRPSHATDLIYV